MLGSVFSLSFKFTGNGLIINDQDHTIFPAANAAAKTFPVYFSFDGSAGRDGFCGFTLPLGNAGTDIFFPYALFIFFFLFMIESGSFSSVQSLSRVRVFATP